MTSVDTNPHTMFAMMRESGRVHQIPFGQGTKAWLITGYEDARRALSDPRLAKGPLMGVRMGGGTPYPPEIQAAMSQHMLNADPPDHTRLRKLVSAAFTARRIENLRPRIKQISDALLDNLAKLQEADLIDDFAFPLPFQVICELLGVPEVDRDQFRAWSNILVASPGTGGEKAYHATVATATYLRDLVGRKRIEPDDGLLSGLIAASDAGDRLNENELTSLVFLLLLAGHETTVNLIGNAMYLLLDRPERAAALRQDPALLPGAVDEILRFESPVKTTTMRISTEPVTFGEVTIPAGEIVMVSLLSANRDGQAFADPDELDLSRQDGQHLAFGHGPHYCLGAPLAKMEGEIAIAGLLTRFPEMLPATDLSGLAWRPGILMRGLSHLPVKLGG